VKSPVAVINLGCARNTVDAQGIVSALVRQGHALTRLDKAEVVIVNTCAFVEDARKESVDTIIELGRLKAQGRIKKIIVAGCLSQRYGAELAGELSEVDAFVGVPKPSADKVQAPPVFTPSHYAYVKICESCFNACSFCAIPKIKGRFASRTREAVLADVRALDARGVREINVIGQDVTAYGLDLYGKKALAGLLKDIARQVKGVRWIRLLYTHPAHITEELLDVLADEPRLCKYIDMPLQHVSDRILKMMNRKMTRSGTEALVARIRRKIPGVFLRTTFITGFPGETAEDFDALLAFVKDHPFERVGVFAFSREEGTPAYDLPGSVPRAVAQRRRDRLMKAQQALAERFHARCVGTTVPVLIEERVQGEPALYNGRTEFDAPEVDGVVHVTSRRILKPGDFVDVRVTGAMAYDLTGDAV
jgi:ribosomal protein S12 methylthiotransferase